MRLPIKRRPANRERHTITENTVGVVERVGRLFIQKQIDGVTCRLLVESGSLASLNLFPNVEAAREHARRIEGIGVSDVA